MANKRTIQQELERQRLLILRIARYSNELKDLNAKIEKMRTGKAKVPAPTPKVVKWKTPAFSDRLDDLC